MYGKEAYNLNDTKDLILTIIYFQEFFSEH